jgi:L-lysine exporter family protein LysE/ArgO
MPGAATAILKGILLGLGAAVPIGPVNVQIARRTLREGFGQGAALGAGAVTVDVLYAIVSAIGFRTIGDRPSVTIPLTITGALFLGFLGVQSLLAARRTLAAHPLEDSPQVEASAGGAYLTGLLMTLLNPMTLGFWFVAVPAAVGVSVEGVAARLPMTCIGVFIGTAAWVLFFAGCLSVAGRYRRRGGLLAAADVVGGGVLLFTAVASLWSLGKRFL